MAKCRIIFITATDTGAGKTVLTGLLLAHLRRLGHNALALKPFCSGARSDPVLLRAVQDHRLELDEINPFHYAQPVAPLVAARQERALARLSEALQHIRFLSHRCDWLLIEGVGGLLVPLGEDYSVLDLIERVRPQVIVTARNKLGAINHTLLTVRALESTGIRSLKVVLVDTPTRHAACRSNPAILAELLGRTPLFRIPFLGPRAARPALIRKASASLSPTLARILR